MISATLPKNEQDRLEALVDYNILDTASEYDYDELTKLATHICGTPISLISLIDEHRQWFKSKQGLDADETPRELAFCSHAILEPNEIFEISDSRIDERFYDNPLVTGDPRVIFYAGVPLVNPKGLPLGTLCVIDSKPGHLSDSQREALRTLGRQVVTMLELRKKASDLRLTNAELLIKNRELNEFARVAAHDIKSPLSSITMLSEYLVKMHKEDVKPEALNMLKMLNCSADKLKNLVDGILDFSQNANILNEQKQVIEVEELLSSTITLIDCKHQSNIDYPKGNTTIYTNKTALQQIILNLLVNAIKYNDKDEAKIDIEFSQSDDFYRFSIKDNGPGIKKDDQDRIFELFEALDGEDRFGNSGTGIGLSTVKKLVEGLGGKITVESEVGNGTTFYFSLKRITKSIYKEAEAAQQM